jgi:hypothetical protein
MWKQDMNPLGPLRFSPISRAVTPVAVLILLACGVRPASSQTAATSAPRVSPRAELRLSVPIDFGVSGSNVPQVLTEGWQAGFQPNNEGMTTGRSGHAFFMNGSVELEPVLAVGGGWKLGIPVVVPVGGMARAAGASTVFYLNRQPVAGTRVDWWDPVLVHATAVSRMRPAAGLSVQRGRFAVRATAGAFSVWVQDYVGQDCPDCKNSSSVDRAVRVSDGIGFRADFVALPSDFGTADGGHAGWGFFFERNGADAWQAGVSFRLVFRLAGRR